MSPTILDITTLLGTISSDRDRSIDVVLSALKFDLDLKSIFDEMTEELLKEKDDRRNWSKEDVAKLSRNSSATHSFLALMAKSTGLFDEGTQTFLIPPVQ